MNPEPRKPVKGKKGFRTMKYWAVFNPQASMVPWLFEYHVEALRFREVVARATGLCDHEKCPVYEVEIRIPK